MATSRPGSRSAPQRRDDPGGATQRVVEHLRDEILSGRWPEGSRLAPGRDLALQLEVSRLTLHSALTVLANEGLVRSRPGSGVEVQDLRRTASFDLFTWLLSHPNEYDESSAELFADLVRLRRIVAIDTLQRAAANITPEELAELDARAEQQRSVIDNPPVYIEGDQEFQRGIIRIAGSIAVELLFNSLEKVMARHRDLHLVFLGPLEEHWKQYGLVCELLRHASPDAAVRAAETVLDVIEIEGTRRVREYCCRSGERS